ncbi:MAG: 3-isopropylmalate dehydratase large subunit [Candidatus Omnitrophica bacterium]|nr:3-isopropylmalate dehydratase large subunit [Candidatus Omnitrophota bacterium]MBU4487559.1 3-isopropylmalate dehydratase large subunit [Candidatus Omnitrophota bacterium]MCG2705799.1 3-isopropylmalate dehydratase large subunit [Candidatus Omnitrophota bacterium]
MGKTIAEKILSSHSGRDLKAGDIAICKVDFCFGQDGTSSLIIDSFNKSGKTKVFNPLKFCMVIDHSAPSPNLGVSEIHNKMREFAKKMKVGLYDVGSGVCHVIIPDEGHVKPGDLVLGADSHTCTYGALNVLSTGVGSTDLAITLMSGHNWFKVPESIKMEITGALKKGVYSKDLILHIIGDVGANGCTYNSVEFYGETIKGLSVDARLTISNMAVEMGAKFGVMEADAKVIDYLKRCVKLKSKIMPVSADKDAHYSGIKEYDASKLEPMVAKPHTVDNVVPVGRVNNVKIDEAYIGTCTNGRLEDLKIAAGILKKQRIHKKLKCIIAPASLGIFEGAVKTGYIRTFIEAGCIVVAPGCGPCVGTHEGILADNEAAISSANRNFKGRMGNPNSFIYLASPATVAASAIEGKIADPRNYL